MVQGQVLHVRNPLTAVPGQLTGRTTYTQTVKEMYTDKRVIHGRKEQTDHGRKVILPYVPEPVQNLHKGRVQQLREPARRLQVAQQIVQ